MATCRSVTSCHPQTHEIDQRGISTNKHPVETRQAMPQLGYKRMETSGVSVSPPRVCASRSAPLVPRDRQVVRGELLRHFDCLALRQAAAGFRGIHDALQQARGEPVREVAPDERADGGAAVAGSTQLGRPVVDRELAPAHREARRLAGGLAVEAADDVVREVEDRRATVACMRACERRLGVRLGSTCSCSCSRQLLLCLDRGVDRGHARSKRSRSAERRQPADAGVVSVRVTVAVAPNKPQGDLGTNCGQCRWDN